MVSPPPVARVSSVGWIGPWRVTSFVPSGKVASTWSSSNQGLDALHDVRGVEHSVRPADMIAETDMPSRAASSTPVGQHGDRFGDG